MPTGRGVARLVGSEMPATEHTEGFPESMSPSLPEPLCPLRSVWGINLWGPPPRLQLSVSLPVPFQETCKADPKKEAHSLPAVRNLGPLTTPAAVSFPHSSISRTFPSQEGQGSA